MDIFKIISNIKNYLVLDNLGLHLTMSYMALSILLPINMIVAFSLVSFGIVIMEVYDKWILKTKFSIKDIVAGLIGMSLAFLVYRYGR